MGGLSPLDFVVLCCLGSSTHPFPGQRVNHLCLLSAFFQELGMFNLPRFLLPFYWCQSFVSFLRCCLYIVFWDRLTGLGQQVLRICLSCFSSAGITNLYHHAQFSNFLNVFGTKLRYSCFSVSIQFLAYLPVLLICSSELTSNCSLAFASWACIQDCTGTA